MILFFLYIAVFVLTFFGVEKFRLWSRKRNILDVPNERSSHAEPTPRGGGLIIGIICVSVFFFYCWFFQTNHYWTYFAGAIAIICISWLDDLFSVSFFLRFLCHGLAAILIIWGFGYWESVNIPLVGTTYFGQFGMVITFLWIVWMVNAYNFMDGIDGIAAIQAVTAGFGWLLIGLSLKSETAGFYGSVLACSSLGFLIHNWQPAKIFMGDVGSAFLGFSFAVLPLIAENELGKENSISGFLPLIAISLTWLFMFDTVLTLFKRIFKREKIWQAHREHIYQKLIIYGRSHQFVSVLYGALSALSTVFWVYKLQSEAGLSKGLIFFIVFQTLVVLSVLYWSKARFQLKNR